MKARFSKTALRQIDEAISYLAVRSPAAASRLSNRIRMITRLVEEHPEAGQATSRKNVRRVLLTPYPYALFYRAVDSEIVIMRLRH